MRKRRFFIVGLTLTLAAGAFIARATQETPSSGESKSKLETRFEKLPDDFARAAAKGKRKLGHKISNAIFDQVSEWNANVTLDNGVSIGVQAGRTVYANDDIEDSFTVADRLSIPLTLPGVAIPIGVPEITFNLGISGKLDFMNLRIVKPSDSLYKQTLLTSLLSADDLEKRRSEAEGSDWLKLAREQATQVSASDYLDATKTGDKPVFFIDSLRNARYGRIWNQFSHPLRIPLKASWLDRMDDSEVISYGGSGTVEVGPSVGLNLNFAGAEGANIGASFRAYLRGLFRISILKLDSKTARVKVTRENTKGLTTTVGASFNLEIFDGFVVAGSPDDPNAKRMAKLKDAVIPFRFTSDRSWGHTLDIGYEYNLNDTRAVEAYEQAVVGRFALSEEMSLAFAPLGENAPVRQVVRRDADTETESRKLKMEMRLLARDASGTYTVEDAVIQFPDGTMHVFKAKTDANFSRKLGFGIWKTKESVSYSIRTDYVEDTRDPENTSNFGWYAEGHIYDNATSGLEMNRYSEMVESLFSKRIFPRLPVTMPVDPDKIRRAANGDILEEPPLEETDFGDSHFFFRVALTPSQMMKLAKISEDEMWVHLENGFERFDGAWRSGPKRLIARIGGWLYNSVGWVFKADQIDQRLGIRFLHADEFMDRFREVKKLLGKIENPSDLTLEQKRKASKMVAELYSDKIFTYELIKTTMLAFQTLNDSQLSFHISAQTMAFPSVDVDGGSITEIEKITQRFARETDFDQPGANRTGQDLELAISNLVMEVKSASLYEIRFTAAKEAPMVLIKIDEVSDFLKFTSTVKRILVPNRGQFPKGDNVLVLDAVGGIGFRKELAERLEPGNTYRFTIALVEKLTSGPAVSVEFKTKPAAQ